MVRCSCEAHDCGTLQVRIDTDDFQMHPSGKVLPGGRSPCVLIRFENLHHGVIVGQFMTNYIDAVLIGPCSPATDTLKTLFERREQGL
jgi:hypothetical protein